MRSGGNQEPGSGPVASALVDGGGGLFAHGRGRVLVFCWLGWVFDFYDLILFAFVRTMVARDLALDLASDLVVIEGWTLLATAVGGIGFGRVADRIGRRRALVASILCYSIGAGLTAFAGGFWTLLGARLVTGLGVGGEWGIGHAVVAETYPERLRGRAAGILQAGSPVAMALAATVGCFAAPEIGWRWCFALSALPALLVVFARAAIPGPDRPPVDDEAPSMAGPGGSILDLFRGSLLRPSIALLAVLFLHMAGFWSVYAWLPTTLIRDAGKTLAFVGFFQIGLNTVHVFADVAFGFLADRFGRRPMFVLFCLVFAGGLALVAANFQALTGDLVTFGVAMAAVGLGAGTWSCFGVLFAEIYPPGLRATAASAFYNAARAMQLPVQIFLLRPLFETSDSFVPALWVGVATSLLSAVAVLGVARPRRGDARRPGPPGQ